MDTVKLKRRRHMRTRRSDTSLSYQAVPRYWQKGVGEDVGEALITGRDEEE